MINLEKVIVEYDRMHGDWPREDIQRENMEYAFRNISPSTHTDAAFVAWAGSRLQAVDDVVDEFCRRRAGLLPIMFDHDLLDLRIWCQPDTHRILIFREQIESLVSELTGKRLVQRLTFEIYRHEIGMKNSTSLDQFTSLIDRNKHNLSHEEITALYDYIKDRYGPSMSYLWCSTLVERALHACHKL